MSLPGFRASSGDRTRPPCGGWASPAWIGGQVAQLSDGAAHAIRSAEGRWLSWVVAPGASSDFDTSVKAGVASDAGAV